MRLIDADELQDAMLNLDEYVELCDVLKIIDNAPTVDKGYNEGHIDGMRLIDADELKKCAIPCEIHNGALTDLCVPLYQIENAPTVDIKTMNL